MFLSFTAQVMQDDPERKGLELNHCVCKGGELVELTALGAWVLQQREGIRTPEVPGSHLMPMSPPCNSSDSN